jgi:hypothetical protein
VCNAGLYLAGRADGFLVRVPFTCRLMTDARPKNTVARSSIEPGSLCGSQRAESAVEGTPADIAADIAAMAQAVADNPMTLNMSSYLWRKPSTNGIQQGHCHPVMA